MKEQEFRKKYPQMELFFPIYYTLDENENVILDSESMREEFEDTIQEINEELESDELKLIVKEKLKMKGGKK